MSSSVTQEGGAEAEVGQQAQQQTGPKPIYAFWGGTAGSSKPPPPTKAQPRKRKKADDGSVQQTLLGQGGSLASQTTASGSSSKTAESQKAAPRKKGKSRAGLAGGEEAELEEMSKRAKQADGKGASKEKRGKKVVRGRIDSSPALSIGESVTSHNTLLNSPTKAHNSLAGPSNTAKSSLVIDLSTNDIPDVDDSEIRITGHKLAKPPLLSRSTSKVSTGASQEDAIDVEEGHRARPRKLVFAADRKAVHPLFARRDNKQNAEDMATGGPAPVTPLEPASRSINVPTSPKKPHSFFSANTGKQDEPGKLKNGWGRGVKEGEEWLPPWPARVDLDLDQPGPSRLAIPRRAKIDCRTEPDNRGLGPLLDLQPTANPVKVDPYRTATPSQIPFIQSHAALRLKGRGSALNRETWCEKYRPKRAVEVLGNETEATYLRDWLQTLAVGGENGRKVIRKARRVKNQLFDDWIVDDAGIFGDPVDEEEEEDEYADFIDPDLPLGVRPDSYPQLESPALTNTILLSGPHGSGKTAAVYAAAAELDWEVFEVYPGMGKRTGGNLMSWVGDVGRNHLVVQSAKAEPSRKSDAMKSFFGNVNANGAKAKARNSPLASQGSASEPIEIDDDPKPVVKELDIKATHDTSGPMRQSLILVDEADILFDEENTFWPTLVNLIAESRRPVVLTCNDTTRIPIAQLPLQTMLHFHPAPTHLAIPYLEEIARKERIHSWTPTNSVGVDSKITLDCLLAPNGNEPLPTFDLRQAITQMQVDRNHPPVIRTPSAFPQDLDRAYQMLDNVSFSDACVSPRDWAIMEMLEVDRYEAQDDDEIGVRMLVKPDIHEIRPTLPLYDMAADMATEIEKLASSGGAGAHVIGDLNVARSRYVRSLLPLLDPLIPLSAPLLPSSSLFLETMPILQSIVETNDVLEAEEEAAVARGESRINRKTGRPRRGGEAYERYLVQETDALDAARGSRLNMKW